MSDIDEANDNDDALDDDAPIVREADDQIPDGIYLDMPLEKYLADTALSGSAFLVLLTEPNALHFEKPANPLWFPKERAQSKRPQLRGSASHCLVLEGPDAYGERYKIKPEGVLSSQTDMQNFIRTKRDAFLATLPEGEKPTKEQKALYLLKADDGLADRCRALDPKVEIWDSAADDILLPADDFYVRTVAAYVHNDPVFRKYVTGGFAEVTIFLTIDGVRFKCRIDYVTAHTLLDMKSYGRPPKRGESLVKACVTAACYAGADLQAVHNTRMMDVAGERFRAGEIKVHQRHPMTTDGMERMAARLVAFNKIVDAHAEKQPEWRWLFVRMGGPLNGVVTPFRKNTQEWSEACEDVDNATATFVEYREACGGTGPWIASGGEQEIGPYDFPPRRSVGG